MTETPHNKRMTIVKKILVFVALAVVSFTSLSAQASDYSLIEKTLNYYLEGGTDNDFQTLKKAFHETAPMKYIDENGEYKEVNAIAFFKGIMKPGPKLNRKTRIASIHISGHAANARLEMEYPTFSYIDYMNLLKINGEWKIVNKIFFTQPKSKH